MALRTLSKANSAGCGPPGYMDPNIGFSCPSQKFALGSPHCFELEIFWKIIIIIIIIVTA
jgi:hypothetical protein